VAEHALGRAIGVFDPQSMMLHHKGIFWTGNRLSDGTAPR
jgi:hypothetical protein